MRLALREEMKEIDQLTALEFGISEDQLMERAGALMAERFLNLPGLSSQDRIGVLCGPGNNGGDGLVMARKLIERGYKNIEVWKLKNPKYSVLFELNLRRLMEMNVAVAVLDPEAAGSFDFNKYQFLVDALFGIGLDRPLDLPLVQFIEKINKQKVSVVSLDVPTGLDVNRGIKWGGAIQAVMTLTCGLAKPGFYIQDGPSCCGKIEILNIGFPPKLVRQKADSVFLVGLQSAKKLLPRRTSVGNKSSFGKLLIIAGNPSMKGAAVLAAEGAARMGVGYVTVASPSAKVVNEMLPDFLHVSWKEINHTDFKKYSAVAVGPGLGTSDDVKEILQRLRDEKIENVVVDADAITVFAKHKLWPVPPSWILTPHAGEMARIIGESAKEIEEDRLAAVKKAAQLTGATVLLKGFRTVVHTKNKSYVIGSGNVALAKAGAGDVLTGFISSLMAQGLAVDRAAALGAFLHGKMADLWVQSGKSSRTLLASDLPNLLNSTLNFLEK